jgi:pimeloyl-ACP methyl ester carboxylesterase/DNA-binding CsgD family transcriptional regulator
LEQQIRFCTAPDGVRIAYALHGAGPPLVRAATWLTHVGFDRRSPLYRHWLARLAEGRTLIRYDMRGCGLSDRETEDLSLDARVGDLASVVDAARLDRFALLGISGAGPVAVAYAVRHPGRVTHLVLYGTYARGRSKRAVGPRAREEAELLTGMMRLAWGHANPAFRRVFTTLFMPDASPEEQRSFDELQRVSASPEMAARIRRAHGDADVTALARQVSVPTMVLHVRDDAAVPFEEGRVLAALIPGARFVPLEGRNHMLGADERAWETFLTEVRSFLGTAGPGFDEGLPDLTAREMEIVDLVAQGLSNDQIAHRMYLSVRTVERHLSNVYAKVGVSGKAARAATAARVARRSGPGVGGA